MQISIVDASNYFKGLLLLIRKDRQVSDPEITIMRRVGKMLGFEKEFTDNAIHDILENDYIEDSPPVFGSKELAKKFIKDGLTIAFADHDECHPAEEAWLWSVVAVNEVDELWFQEEYRAASLKKERPLLMEVDDVTVKYTQSVR
jgi:hypothetical protein